MKIRAEWTGLNEMFATVNTLRKNVRNRVLRPAVSAGGQKVLTAMRRKCPVDKGTRKDGKPMRLLKRSLGKKIKTYPGGGTVIAIVGPMKGFRTQVGVRKRTGTPFYQDPANIGHLVEKGHGGPHPAPPHPFARPALEESKSAVLAVMAQKIGAGIEKEAQRAKK